MKLFQRKPNKLEELKYQKELAAMIVKFQEQAAEFSKDEGKTKKERAIVLMGNYGIEGALANMLVEEAAYDYCLHHTHYE
jgi:hypothetical protein